MLGTPFLVLPLVSFFNIKLLGCVLVPIALYCIYGIIYRLYFSPASSFPGPRLAALTFAYEFYYDIVNNGQYIWKIQRLHEKYGPVVCINPYEIHVSDPEFHDTFFSNDRSANKWYWSTKIFPIEHSLFSTIDYQTHRMRRGALNQFFSMQRARQLQPMVQKRVDTLINRILDCQTTGEVIIVENALAAMANGRCIFFYILMSADVPRILSCNIALAATSIVSKPRGSTRLSPILAAPLRIL